MNKKGLVLGVSAETGLSQDKVTQVINSLIGNINASLAEGEDVKLMGLGTFSKRLMCGYTVKHPLTKVPYDIPDKFIPKFIAGSDMKRAVKE